MAPPPAPDVAPAPWERAEQIRAAMEAGGFTSIRAYARAVGEDFSKITRALKILDLPQEMLAWLRAHGGDPDVRRRLTGKRLRGYLDRRASAGEILGEVEGVALLGNP